MIKTKYISLGSTQTRERDRHVKRYTVPDKCSTRVRFECHGSSKGDVPPIYGC